MTTLLSRNGTLVVKDGPVVWRQPHPNDAFVQQVLTYLEQQGFAGAPRFRGVDEHGRQALSFIPGIVYETEEELSAEQVLSSGELLRQFHDIIAASSLCGQQETVCHGDAGPHNIVFQGQQAVALIDWEFATPGARQRDLADVAWCLLDERWEHEQAGSAQQRISLFCEGYGNAQLDQVIEEVSSLVREARCRHDQVGAVHSVAHFERLLGWLQEHDSELKGQRCRMNK